MIAEVMIDMMLRQGNNNRSSLVEEDVIWRGSLLILGQGGYPRQKT